MRGFLFSLSDYWEGLSFFLQVTLTFSPRFFVFSLQVKLLLFIEMPKTSMGELFEGKLLIYKFDHPGGREASRLFSPTKLFLFIEIP